MRLRFEGSALSSEYYLTAPAQRVEIYAADKNESADGPGTRMVLGLPRGANRLAPMVLPPHRSDDVQAYDSSSHEPVATRA